MVVIRFQKQSYANKKIRHLQRIHKHFSTNISLFVIRIYLFIMRSCGSSDVSVLTV